MILCLLVPSCAKQNNGGKAIVSSTQTSVLNTMVSELSEYYQDSQTSVLWHKFNFEHPEGKDVYKSSRVIGAWQFAAASCALLTNNPCPSYQEVIDTGLWPYQVEHDFDLSSATGDTGDFAILNEVHISDIGSDEWFVQVRSTILSHFYRDYYFCDYNIDGTLPQFTVTHPSDLQEYTLFWINPSDRSSYIVGTNFGQIRYTPASWVGISRHLVDSELNSESVKLKQINILPNPEGKIIFDAPLNKSSASIDANSAKGASEEGWCCVYVQTFDPVLPNETHNGLFHCQCPDSEEISTCIIQWQWPEASKDWNYEYYAHAPCSENPGPGSSVFVPCGEYLNWYSEPVGSSPGTYTFNCIDCPEELQFETGEEIPSELLANCPDLESLLIGITMPSRVIRMKTLCQCPNEA